MNLNYKLLDQFIALTLESATKFSGTIAPLVIKNQKLSILKNISYGPLPEQVLDIYKSTETKNSNLPITILIHGGGFRFFSKDSHAAVAAELAKDDRLVFNLNYRLTPKHPYPAGLIDTITAYSWIIENAKKHGGDLNNISIVGESAGGNFSLALCLHLFGVQTLKTNQDLPKIPEFKPKHAVIHCGHLYVSNVDRYLENKDLNLLVLRRILQIQRDYLPPNSTPKDFSLELAGPLIEIEKLAATNQRLPEGFPQIFVPVGENDPVGGDSHRLAKALETLGQKNRLKVYPGEGHAFYVMTKRKNARICWVDIFNFLNN